MSCFCLPRHSDSRTTFHWPNFSFSHSQQQINPRSIHSTFSLYHIHKHKPRRFLKRRHTLPNGTVVANLDKRKPSHHSLKSTKTAPATVVVSADDMSGEKYAPPPGPPPSYQSQSSNEEARSQPHVSWAKPGNKTREMFSKNPFHKAHVNASQGQPPSSSDPPPEYEAPPGPPPTWNDKKAPLPDDGYAPPSGPPPSHHEPSEPEPPPYDPWLAVPDNALLPPPPSLREEKSPTSNASWGDAARGHAWCEQNPLWSPRRQNQQTLSRIANGDIYLTTPPNTKHVHLTHTGKGRTRIGTNSKCTDTVFLSDIPLYTALPTSPKTIYYELHILSIGSHHKNEEAGISIGFLAPPYPSWRQPGWHRATLAVHGDDGRRYIDDSFGGLDFTGPFRKNDVVGIGMSFSPPSYMGGKARCEVFFTRNGKREGGWDLHEERDREQEDGEVVGLEGKHDLLAAVGCFGSVEFEVRMRREDWAFKPAV